MSGLDHIYCCPGSKDAGGTGSLPFHLWYLLSSSILTVCVRRPCTLVWFLWSVPDTWCGLQTVVTVCPVTLTTYPSILSPVTDFIDCNHWLLLKADHASQLVYVYGDTNEAFLKFDVSIMAGLCAERATRSVVTMEVLMSTIRWLGEILQWCLAWLDHVVRAAVDIQHPAFSVTTALMTVRRPVIENVRQQFQIKWLCGHVGQSDR